MSFGKHLRTERTKRKLLAEDLARRCGVSRSYITLMESGKRLPGKSVIPKIAEALNLKLSIVVNWYLDDVKDKIGGKNIQRVSNLS